MLARQNNITLSVYPDSTNTLISEDEDQISKTFKELNFHSWFFENAGFPSNTSNPIVIKPYHVPQSDSHNSIVSDLKVFYKNFKSLNKETQNQLVLQNECAGFWDCVNLFKYFHVYLHEKYEDGMVLSYHNLADQQNPGSFDGTEDVDSYVNIGAFHETWMGVVPVFLWSEKDSNGTPI